MNNVGDIKIKKEKKKEIEREESKYYNSNVYLLLFPTECFKCILSEQIATSS